MKLARINQLLLVLIILVNGYIIAAPFLPTVTFWWNNRGGTHQKQLTHQLQVAKKPTPNTSNQPASHPNGLVIPVMLLDQPVHEGPIRDTYKILNQGIWRWPNGSTPDKGGNTVFIGHRFTYTQPKGVFYYLNKVQLGDEIGVWWNNKLYVYKVSTISEVPPTQTSIEDPTSDARLTIFTCTPLWLPNNRLVVVAQLENNP